MGTAIATSCAQDAQEPARTRGARHARSTAENRVCVRILAARMDHRFGVRSTRFMVQCVRPFSTSQERNDPRSVGSRATRILFTFCELHAAASVQEDRFWTQRERSCYLLMSKLLAMARSIVPMYACELSAFARVWRFCFSICKSVQLCWLGFR